MKRYLSLLLFAALFVAAVARAQDSFVVSDIRVEGLQRISAASVFAALPINVGDTVSGDAIRNSIRTLFRTGNFDNISISRDGTILVVTVEERPSISEINIDGNKAIETKALLDGLKKSGLSEGQVFKRSTLESMKVELTRQYVSQGRYDARIDTDVEALPRNRVAVNININEGTTASIKQINFVGNTVYDDETLRDLFELKTTGWFSWLTSNDRYSKEKLSGDLETLKSHYLDNGYIKFNIDSTQVSVTPDRKAVYITINVNEGDKYTVGKVDLSGDLVVPQKQLRPFIFVHDGETFSQAKVTNTEEWITKRLGNDGYNFAKVHGIPTIHDDTKVVDIKFFIDPGKRTYVRRINFEGNLKTADEVLRREMRQMESAPASSSAIETSRVRLERLGYFKDAKVDTVEVPGTDDLIDLKYSVEEQPSGSIGASVGFSQDSGVLLGANVQQDNFMGTGKKIGVGINKSDYLTSVKFSYDDPYYTKDGVSRGFSVYYREVNYDKINISSYNTNTYGAALTFGYPIKETESLQFSLGYSNTKIEAGYNAVQEIASSPRPLKVRNGSYANYYQSNLLYTTDANGNTVPLTDANGSYLYSAAEVPLPVVDSSSNPLDVILDANGNPLPVSPFSKPSDFPNSVPGFLDEFGDTFNDYTVTTSWVQSTLNRGRLATRGASQRVSLELAVPGSDLKYFKLTYDGQIFVPLTEQLTLRLRTGLGFGDGFGGNDLPFFNHFYSGGFGSVRGFRSNTLGPRSTPALVYPDVGRAVTDIVKVGDTGCDDPSDAGKVTGDQCSGGAYVGAPSQYDDKYSYILRPGQDKFLVAPYQSTGDPFGGNALVEGSAEVLFPLPFIKDQRSVRSAFFFDAGNVFSTHCRVSQANCYNVDLGELRYSVGVGVSWITGFGPLTFSYARPLNETKEDKVEAFQFSLGRSF